MAAEILEIDAFLDGAITAFAQSEEFQGKWLQTAETLLKGHQAGKKLLLIGAGKKTDQPPARARQLGLKIAEKLSGSKAKKIAVAGVSRYVLQGTLVAQIFLGVKLGFYKYPSLNPKEEQLRELETPLELSFVATAAGKDLAAMELVARHIENARLLQDGPPNIVTPKFVSESIEAQLKAAQSSKDKQASTPGFENIKCEIFGAQKLRQMGFNAMMAVAGGSANEPQLIALDYTPKQYEHTIAFVGKGLTMDTGGYSLKPANSMVGMKYDMCGSAVVLQSLFAIAALQLPIRVVAVGAMVENMVDAHAYRVGDILKTLSGKTIEVLNTDAEGRIVLSDALYYTATQFKPDCIFEYSTLTGAMVVSLGHVAAGVFAFNHPEIGNLVEAAAKEVGEKVWQLPTWEEYGEDVKGTFADVNNIQNTAGAAGSPTSAMFLSEFVDNKPFVHIDIAGVANASQALGYPKKISSGFGIQLNVELAKAISKGSISFKKEG